MKPIIFYPEGRYLFKLYLNAVGSVLFYLLVMGIMAANAISSSNPGAFTLLLLGFIALVIVSFALTTAYFNSIRYEIHEDEIVVHVGIITKSVKHVPFRTITNIMVTRGIVDRILGIGSLSIQTAGSGGSSVPEEKLNGLEEVQGIYEHVAQELRRFRQGMSPTQANGDDTPRREALRSPDDSRVLPAILAELRAIREMMQRQN